MNVTTTARTSRDTQAITREATVTGAEPIPWTYTNGRRWRIASVFVRWERARTDGGAWGQWSTTIVTLAGFSIKKDGGEGASRHENFYRSDSRIPDEIQAWTDAEFAALPE